MKYPIQITKALLKSEALELIKELGHKWDWALYQDPEKGKYIICRNPEKDDYFVCVVGTAIRRHISLNFEDAVKEGYTAIDPKFLQRRKLVMKKQKVL